MDLAKEYLNAINQWRLVNAMDRNRYRNYCRLYNFHRQSTLTYRNARMGYSINHCPCLNGHS